MSRKEGMTTITVSKKARDELKALGKKGESYDKIVRKLIRLARSKKVG